MSNPFTCYHALPRYDELTPAGAEEAITTLLCEARRELAVLASRATPTWDGCMAPRLALAEPLQYAWHLVSHMLSAMNTPAWRSTQEKLQPQVVAFFAELGQNQALFQQMKVLRDSPAYAGLTEAQQRILESDLRQALHAGADCPPEVQAELTRLQEQNAADQATFMNHTLDASKVVVLTLRTPADTHGLPVSLREAASAAARQHGYPQSTPAEGPWIITHEAPLYIPFMQYSERRDLREILYRAYVTRSSHGALDNQPILRNLLQRRRRIARLLGKDTYADLTLEDRMAPSVAAVKELIERIRTVAWPAAQEDYRELEDYARQQGQSEPLAAWDLAFWSERIRKQRFTYDSEALRPYFPLPHVLECLFQTVLQLFGVTIEPADGQAQVWHPDVRFFTVRDTDGKPMAHLYLDPYSRPETKRGGAWMDAVLSRARRPDGSVRLPAALICCNQSRPNGDHPSLMTLAEITTLYHECGHALQHMLTEVDLAAAAGIHNVEWDAVELASQFMENWVFQRSCLRQMSCHHETGDPLPESLMDQVIAARWFQAGLQTLRQLFFAAVDMGLHHDFDPEGPVSPDDLKLQVAARYALLPPLPEDRFLCGFSHIFGGGYAAGYYSYKWAEVLAADAFAAFEEAGITSAEAVAATGMQFRKTVLACGGARHPMDVFRAFRGRDPDPDALLRQAGLLPAKHPN